MQEREEKQVKCVMLSVLQIGVEGVKNFTIQDILLLVCTLR